MALQIWSQDNFSRGELSPFMYARASVEQYFQGLKTAQNVLCYPTGAAGKRFGTLFNSICSGFTSAKQVFFQTFQYLDECTYQLIFAPDNIFIYLEGLLVKTITGTLLDAEQCYNLSSTVLQDSFIIAGFGLVPTALKRFPDTPNIINAVAANVWSLGAVLPSAGIVLPIKVTTTGTLPNTIPPINVGVTYFVKTITTSSVKVYASSYNAANDIEAFQLLDIGTGLNYVVTQNNWVYSPLRFKTTPVYDFNGNDFSYDAITFTPSAVSGNAVTITLSVAYAPLDASYIGGAFIGGSGIGRITAVASTSSFTIATETSFNSITPILGSLASLTEPAWSTKRGFPIKCSSYQNRALFANTVSTPNGFWASTINDYSDFNDLQTDDDNAISWYPTSNDINYIRFIVPYRSITVHTNSGIYSSPLSDISAITPKTFTLQLQDSTPADVLQPRAIDNQIIVLSGNDAHSMIWDGINNAYTSDIVSVVNEQTIRNPVDEEPFADLKRAGSRYILIVNDNGSMAIFQTLIAQNVQGFTPQIMEQSYGTAQFRQVASNSDGRCWFLNERQIATAVAPIAITAFSATTLTAVASNLSTTVPVAITFTTTGTLPSSTPTLAVQTYYWAKGVTANTFSVYATQTDALAGVNAFAFISSGTTSFLVSWPLSQIFTIEELTQDTFLDCAVSYNGAPTDTVTTGTLFNAQAVKMVGDGFGFSATGVNNQVVFQSHGETVPVSKAYVGFPIQWKVQPMPLTSATQFNQSPAFLTRPKHIRSVSFMFNNTIGGEINGVPIALNRFDQANIGLPPFPERGIFEMFVNSGWDDFNNPTFTITHDEPFNIQLLGLFYLLDI